MTSVVTLREAEVARICRLHAVGKLGTGEAVGMLWMKNYSASDALDLLQRHNASKEADGDLQRPVRHSNPDEADNLSRTLGIEQPLSEAAE